MKLGTYEKMMIAARMLADGSLKNRYQFHRVLDKSTPPVAAAKAIVGRVFHGR